MKFCFGCQTYREPESMQKIIRGRGRIARWICATCLARENKSPYASKKKPAKELTEDEILSTEFAAQCLASSFSLISKHQLVQYAREIETILRAKDGK